MEALAKFLTAIFGDTFMSVRNLTVAFNGWRFFITMNESNKHLLKRIADDDKILEALESVLLSSLDMNDLNPEGKSREQVGEEAIALSKARQLVGEGLKQIKQLKTNTKQVERVKLYI